MLAFNLAEEILRWKEEYGATGQDSHGVPYPYIEWGKRKELLIILLTTLKEMGAEKGHFKSARFRDPIVKACTGPKGAISKKAYTTGMKLGYEDLDRAILEVFGTDSDYYKKHGKSRITLTIETEESSLEAKVKDDSDKEAETKIDPPSAIRTPENTVESKPIKKFDPSKSDVPEVDDMVDPEMAELLGYNDER